MSAHSSYFQYGILTFQYRCAACKNSRAAPQSSGEHPEDAGNVVWYWRWIFFFLRRKICSVFPAQFKTRTLGTGGDNKHWVWGKKEKKTIGGGEKMELLHPGGTNRHEILDFKQNCPVFWERLTSTSHLEVRGSEGPSSTMLNATDLLSATNARVILRWIESLTEMDERRKSGVRRSRRVGKCSNPYKIYSLEVINRDVRV